MPLYAACVCWTLAYDTIYAHQDKAGIPVRVRVRVRVCVRACVRVR